MRWGGEDTGEQQREREKEDRFVNIGSHRLGGGGPQRGREGPGLWAGKGEGECHPI